MNQIIESIDLLPQLEITGNTVFRLKKFILKYNIDIIDAEDYKRWLNTIFSTKVFPNKLVHVTDNINNNVYIVVDLAKVPRKEIGIDFFNWNSIRPTIFLSDNRSKWKTIVDYLSPKDNTVVDSDNQQLIVSPYISQDVKYGIVNQEQDMRIINPIAKQNLAMDILHQLEFCSNALNRKRVSKEDIMNITNNLQYCLRSINNITNDKITIVQNNNYGTVTHINKLNVDNTINNDNSVNTINNDNSNNSVNTSNIDNSVNTKTKYKYTCNDDFMIPPPLLNEDEAFKKCPSSKVLKPFYIERKTDPMLHTIIEDKSTSIFRYVGVYPIDNLPTDAYSMYDVRVDDYRELIGVLDDKNYKMACIAYRNKANKYLSRYRYNLVDQDLFDEMCQLELWWTLIIPDYYPQPLTSLEDLERETIQESDWFKQQLVKFTDFKSLKTPFSLQGPIAHMRLTNIVLWKLREWLIEMGVPQECFNETRW